MITKREIEYIASGLRNIQPMARDYAPETMREANAAVAQWLSGAKMSNLSPTCWS